MPTCTLTIKLLLVAAWISADLALWDWTRQQGIVWPQTAAAGVLGAIFAQAALVAIGCAWSPANAALRVALAGLSLYALASFASSVVAEPAARDKWFTLLLMQAAALGAICQADALLNPGSLRSVFRSATERSNETAGRRRCQFGLAGLLTLTTATALALGALEWTSRPAKPLPIVAAFSWLAAVNGYVTTRLLPRPGKWASLAGILLFGVLCGWLMGRTSLPPCEPEKLMLTACVQVTLVAGSLAVCRIGAGNSTKMCIMSRV